MNIILPASPDKTAIAILRANIAASIAASPLTLEEIRERSGAGRLSADASNAEKLTVGQIHHLGVALGVSASEWFRMNPES